MRIIREIYSDGQTLLPTNGILIGFSNILVNSATSVFHIGKKSVYNGVLVLDAKIIRDVGVPVELSQMCNIIDVLYGTVLSTNTTVTTLLSTCMTPLTNPGLATVTDVF